MEKNILDNKPEELWKIFNEITKVPRPSKHETKITEFVKNFGEDLGLETIVDKVGNVIIRKPPTKNMENRKGVILQGHMDMVPEKCENSSHDFEKDPILTIDNGEWVCADCTTLGADNGIGVSAAMAILQSDNLSHGPIEGLFTVDEETDMTGANSLEPGVLNGDILLNLDTEEDGSLYIGSAGGSTFEATFNTSPQKLKKENKAYELKVSGLIGGHSGADIHLPRGNAIKILTNILWDGFLNCDIDLSFINAGSATNAIPREANAVITMPEDEINKFEKILDKVKKTTFDQFPTEKNLKIELISYNTPEYVLDNEAKWGLLSSLYLCPNGVIKMSEAMDDLVETSNNLAIVKMKDDEILVKCLLRSSVDSGRLALEKTIQNIFELFKAKTEINGQHSGWNPNTKSQILKTMEGAYEEIFGKPPKVKAIHAGLECGVLGGKYPNWDMISFGPTIKDAHTPDERVNIETVEKFWKLLITTLEEIPST